MLVFAVSLFAVARAAGYGSTVLSQKAYQSKDLSSCVGLRIQTDAGQCPLITMGKNQDVKMFRGAARQLVIDSDLVVTGDATIFGDFNVNGMTIQKMIDAAVDKKIGGGGGGGGASLAAIKASFHFDGSATCQGGYSGNFCDVKCANLDTGFTYVGPACKYGLCENESCPKGFFRTGACSVYNNGYVCNKCSCPSGQYAKGCGGLNKGVCTACGNKVCPTGKFRSGTCSGSMNGYVCSLVHAVFTRWGNRACPSGTTKLYDGFIAGAHYTHNGSGTNLLCMHPAPQFPPGMSTGNQNGALLYGAEYQNTGAIDKNHDKDAGCSVCQHNTRSTVYTQWGRTTCTNGHARVYYGLILANHYTQKKNMFICVDWLRDWHDASANGDQNGALLYSTEMEGGSSDEAAYGTNREISCVVCSSPKLNAQVYSRWGSRTCPSGAALLYTGFMASSHYTHNGSGANFLCMHPTPQWLPGMSNGNHNGALLYGAEYQNTGAVDKNHDKDAACAVCQREGVGSVYTQWGRQTCSGGHKREYWGVVMANHYTQKRSEFMCIDWERAFHAKSANADQNGALLYTTEVESGSAASNYATNRETSCVVCSSPKSPVYTRWGQRTCPEGANLLYTGWVGGGHYTHNGSGSNYLCMHPNPQFPPGYSNGNHNGALIYGTEYENTGAVDKNHDKDAACAVCYHTGRLNMYTQWGRMSCSNGHRTEYTGVVMANHYTQKKSWFICVDWNRAFTAGSKNTNHNGALLYTTEVEGGSANTVQYGTNKEISCAVCSPQSGCTINENCPDGQYRSGDCGPGIANTYKCNPCKNANCGAGNFRVGPCDALSKGFTCQACLPIMNCQSLAACPDAKTPQCSKCKTGFYLKNGAADTCVVCANIVCPKGKFRGGTCSGTTNGYICSSDKSTFTRWGSRACPSGATKLYEGFVTGAHYTHNGSGTNMLCMHPTPEWAPGMSNGNNNGALLYGAEYQNTGAIDKNHDKDVACSVCQYASPGAYTQWGRRDCTNGHKRMYWGLVMANHYTQKKSWFICVDWERAFHAKSSNADNNGALLYTTEVEQGSANEDGYGHDKEVGCAVCVPPASSKVYPRWGHRACPSGSTLLYSGWIGSSHYTQNGSGANQLCMHPSPQLPPGTNNGNQNGALIYGTEYQNTGAIDKNHDKDAACSMCMKAGVGTIYTQWGRQTCSNGHTKIYWGVSMSDHYTHRKSEFICVDWERAFHVKSSNADNNGNLLYTTEMEGGSSDETQYPHNREIGCVVCASKMYAVYSRWGHKSCPSSATLLYTGFMANGHYTHNGSGSNFLCMHPTPQWPPGMSTGNQNGALLYGAEYQNTGAVDLNHDKDAACAVCESKTSPFVYTQWGRRTCSNGHKTEYWGIIMGNHYTQKRNQFTCIDWARQFHQRSNNGDQNGSLLYTTEMESGSIDETNYGVNREISCAVCSI